MSREAAIERALTCFDDGRYFDEVAHRVAILTESQNPECLPDLYRYLTEEMQPAFDDNADDFQASRTDPDHRWPSYIAASVTRTTGDQIVELPNSGGSICNYIFQDTLGLPLCLDTAFLCRMLAACTARIYSKKSDARGYCDHGRRLLGYRPPCGTSARTELTS